jgi:hypothetical protein
MKSPKRLTNEMDALMDKWDAIAAKIQATLLKRGCSYCGEKRGKRCRTGRAKLTRAHSARWDAGDRKALAALVKRAKAARGKWLDKLKEFFKSVQRSVPCPVCSARTGPCRDSAGKKWVPHEARVVDATA